MSTRKRNNILLLLLMIVLPAGAQQLTYEQYIQRVKTNNISYLAEQYNVSIADANLQAAKVFNDPELSVGYANNQDWSMKMGQSFEAELGYSLPLANVRGARIAVARAEKALADASVADYFRNLKAESAVAYYEALKQQRHVDLLYSSYQQMNRLAQSDSVRLALGEGTETDAMQSRLEAQTLYHDYLQAQADFRNSLTQLSLLMGDTSLTSLTGLADELSLEEREYTLANLFQTAELQRADLQMALHTQTLSEKNLRLVKASRALELGLSVGFAHNTIVENEIAPAPKHNSFSVGVSIPLKFSNSNKGEVRAAQYAIQQSQAALEAAKLQIHTEVLQAYNQYEATCQMARRFSTQMIATAESILRNKTFAYQQGEASLLEVLDAQRTYNEVSMSYVEVLCNAKVAQTELERVVGL